MAIGLGLAGILTLIEKRRPAAPRPPAGAIGDAGRELAAAGRRRTD